MNEIGAIFHQANFLLRTEFIDHHVAFIPRTCNKQAHALAASGIGSGGGVK
jgi:hypothetical protein